MFSKAESISRETDGAFDITVAPLVNAWGFGFKSGVHPSRHVVDSLRQFVGYKKVALVDGRIVKKDPRLMLDCSGIAKGYGVDVVAKLLRDKGIENFMVEIGGEIVTSGISHQAYRRRYSDQPGVADGAQRHGQSYGDERQLPQLLL